MPTLWDVAQERRLLLAIIELTNPKPPSWQDVSAKMGGNFSSEACRQHYQKIKKTTKDGGTEPTTPRKPSAGNKNTPKSGKSTGSKRKQAESFNATTEDDEEPSLASFKGGSAGHTISVDDNGSPKKVKLEHALQNGPICKTEDLTADGAVDLVDDALYT